MHFFKGVLKEDGQSEVVPQLCERTTSLCLYSCPGYRGWQLNEDYVKWFENILKQC